MREMKPLQLFVIKPYTTTLLLLMLFVTLNATAFERRLVQITPPVNATIADVPPLEIIQQVTEDFKSTATPISINGTGLQIPFLLESPFIDSNDYEFNVDGAPNTYLKTPSGSSSNNQQNNLTITRYITEEEERTGNYPKYACYLSIKYKYKNDEQEYLLNNYYLSRENNNTWNDYSAHSQLPENYEKFMGVNYGNTVCSVSFLIADPSQSSNQNLMINQKSLADEIIVYMMFLPPGNDTQSPEYFDNNIVSAIRYSVTLKKNLCGDGFLDGDEECDLGDANNDSDSSKSGCETNCKVKVGQLFNCTPHNNPPLINSYAEEIAFLDEKVSDLIDCSSSQGNCTCGNTTQPFSERTLNDILTRSAGHYASHASCKPGAGGNSCYNSSTNTLDININNTDYNIPCRAYFNKLPEDRLIKAP